MLELLGLNLRDAGFTVCTAATGTEALHRARRQLPDLIVLDVLLPDLDGMSVCEILRQQPSTAGIPVLMLTALGGQLSRCAGLESGADDYLVKPIGLRDLVRRVTTLLQRATPDPLAPPRVNSRTPR